ncbi:MAG: Holliday junction resolvase RuvX [Candidatus Shapirobacteria bacterium]|nr:Holliday junction resolvase RuvX [Candidatus Shapirobacteria bacterium]
MSILGIDFGLKKIGLALADMESKLATPWGTIKVKEKTQDVIKKIKFLCEKEKVEKIVIGLPESGIVGKIKNFGDDLTKVTNLPVFYEDESLTSKEALVKMIESGMKKKARQEKEDQIAAALILQNYLDKNYV